MSHKTDTDLRNDIEASEKFFRGMRGMRGSQLSPKERDRILAAGRKHAERAETARRELATRGPNAKAAMRAEATAWERLRAKFGDKSRAELRELAEAEAEQQRSERKLARRGERDGQRTQTATRPGQQPKASGGWRLEDGGGETLAALFGSPTLWAMARSRGESGNLQEVLGAEDIATLWWVCGRMEEDGVDSFVLEHGQRQHVSPLRELPGWKASLERLTEVGLLSRRQQRGRTEYRLGANAVRMIKAAALELTLPFVRIEDLDAAKLT